MGKKVMMYLIDGSDDGPRTVEIGNWSGKAISCPRSMLINTLKRSEYDKPGVYLLKSVSSSPEYEQRVYIGEAEILRNRFNQHIRNTDRDFDECVAFISKDEMLTKAHVKYLEARLIEIAKEVNNSEIENQKQPSLNLLHEADVSDMEEYLNQVKLILPTLGYNTYIPEVVVDNYQIDVIQHNDLLFYIKSNKVNAIMVEDNEGFKVLKNSEAVPEVVKSMADNWKKLRKKLIGSSIMEKQGDVYIFNQDTRFSSTSAAAAVILGRQAPGPLHWKDKNGKTFKEYEIERLE